MPKKPHKGHVLTSEDGKKGRAAQAALVADVKVELPVETLKDCEREDVLQFCVEQLKTGTTYNELRKKLGLGPMHVDGRWRKIRRLLLDMVLPKDEEEALLAGYSSTQFMIRKMESYLTKLERRRQEKTFGDEKDEALFWKLELDAMRTILEKQEARTLHYFKMKDLQKSEKGRRGSTIIFQNNFNVPRPGEVPKDVTPMQDAAKLIGQIHDLEDDDE